MKRTRNLTLAIACLIVMTATVYADEALEIVAPGTLDVLTALESEDWNPVAEGAWERIHPDGRVETYATGEEGLSWVLLELRAQLETLVDRYLSFPDEEMREVLETHMALIEDIEGNLLEAGTRAPETKAASENCTEIFLGQSAEAGPLSCGNEATAGSYYYADLYSYPPNPYCTPCTVHAYAYASRTCGPTTTASADSCTDTGTVVNCYAQTSQTGAFSSCYSYAFASLSCPAPLSLYLSTSDSSTSCATGMCPRCAEEEEEHE